MNETRHILRSGSRLVYNKTDWMGIDSIGISDRYPGIVFLPHYNIQQQLLTGSQGSGVTLETDTEDNFYR